MTNDAPRDSAYTHHIIVFHRRCSCVYLCFLVDYQTFLKILNRPDGFKPAGTPGASVLSSSTYSFSLLTRSYRCVSSEEFIRGFQVFDKEGNGFIGAGELRYVLTQLGEKMSDEEVDELLKGVQIGACVFASFHPRPSLTDSTYTVTATSTTSPSSGRFSASDLVLDTCSLALRLHPWDIRVRCSGRVMLEGRHCH